MSFEPPNVHRYAVYAVPERDSALWHAGRRWLGRCAETGESLPPALSGCLPEWHHALLREPRRYGWHATLRAPFQLRAGVEVADLRASLRALSERWGAVSALPLHVTQLGRFMALCAPEPGAMRALAQACVVELDALAAPLTDGEFARRSAKAALDARETELLRRWGYPFVMDRYRFHYSLTGALTDVPPDIQQRVHAAAQDCFDALAPQPLGQIALFAEPAPGADFQLLERF